MSSEKPQVHIDIGEPIIVYSSENGQYVRDIEYVEHKRSNLFAFYKDSKDSKEFKEDNDDPLFPNALTIPKIWTWKECFEDAKLACYFGEGERCGLRWDDESDAIDCSCIMPPIDQEMAEFFKGALAAYASRKPEKQEKTTLNMLRWLVYWTSWAVKECKKPAIQVWYGVSQSMDVQKRPMHFE